MSGTLYIAEVDALGHDSTGRAIPAGIRPLLVPPYSILITNSVQLTPIFSTTTRFIEMHCDVECWFSILQNPDPVVTAEHLGPGERIFYPLRIGVERLRLGVIGAAP